MAKFIEFTPNGSEHQILLNIETIESIYTNQGGGASIYLNDLDGDEQTCMISKESYDTIKEMVSSATGSIPINPELKK